MSSYAGPSNLSYSRVISGTTTGLLDSTQPERLHHFPGSTLSFAAFHPFTASSRHSLPNLTNISLDEELCRPKRVVIETSSGLDARCIWRFVPRARLQHGVEDEGIWPRVVEICGELVLCSQEQWDIYKLDPEYDCYVLTAPAVTRIAKKTTRTVPNERSSSTSTASQSPPSFPKRRPPTPSSEDRPSMESRKKFRPYVTVVDSSEDEDDMQLPIPVSDDDEEDEVEGLIADGHSGTGELARRFRERLEENRRQRREKIAARIRSTMNDSQQDQEMIDLTHEDGKRPMEVKPTNTGKRKISPTEEPSIRRTSGTPERGNEHHSDTSLPGQKPKRARSRSPPLAKHELNEKRAKREKKRLAHFRERLRMRNQAIHEIFMESVMADVPTEPPQHEYTNDPAADRNPMPDQEEPPAQNETPDEEALHRAAIEESRRKLAELERDRPLWEEAARRRRAAELAEEEARRARKEAERRAAEAENMRKRREAAQAEAERQAKAAREKATREEEKRRRQYQQERWSHGPWTTARALERYRALTETFDNAKFTTSSPLTFDAVPWPVLASPALLTVEDIDWSAVEAFFSAVQQHMRTQDYKMFVEKSHKRFHPDRWRARGLLKSIEDDQTRSCLEVAANTVAQALTPMWRQVKGG